MLKHRLILFCISFILICLNLKSQKRNNLIFEASALILNPIKKEIHFVHEKEFADDYAYDIKMAPKISYGFKGAIGYQFCLGKGEEIKFNVPISLSYKFISMRDAQIGEYYGGYANDYFYGNRYSNVFINVFSLSSGLNTSFVNSLTGNEWNIDLNFLNNLNTITGRDLKETPLNCITCQSKEEKYNFMDLSYFIAFDLKVSKLYRKEKILIGPMVGYTYNLIQNINPLNSSQNNLKYYNLIEIGVKFKI